MMRTILCTLLLSAISLSAHAAVEVENAFIRAIPPGQQNTAAFMTLHNTSAKALTLVSARASVATATELHTHTEQNGVMQMRQVAEIELKAGSKTELKPGGLHIMLLGLTESLAAGDNVELTLKYADGSEQQLAVPVQPVTAGHHHHH